MTRRARRRAQVRPPLAVLVVLGLAAAAGLESLAGFVIMALVAGLATGFLVGRATAGRTHRRKRWSR